MAAQYCQRRIGQHRTRTAASQSLQDGLGQQPNVVTAFAQRRQLQFDHIETVEQVLPEPALFDACGQILVGGADQAHVDRLFGSCADLAHAPLLDRAQQLDLHRQRQVCHFVEQQGAAVSRLKKSITVVGRTGEGALSVAEKLRFHQRFGNRTAVHGDERLVAARAQGVDVARGELLAAAGFAVDRHRRHAARQPHDLRAQVAHRGRLATQAQGTRHRRLRRLPGCRTAEAAGAGAQGRLHHGAQLIERNRLGEIVERTRLERDDGIVGAAECGDHGDWRVLVLRRDLLDQFDPESVSQPHVGQHQCIFTLAQVAARSRQRFGAVDIESHADQGDLQQFAQIGFVVDYQDARRRHGRLDSSCLIGKVWHWTQRGTNASLRLGWRHAWRAVAKVITKRPLGSVTFTLPAWSASCHSLPASSTIAARSARYS